MPTVNQLIWAAFLVGLPVAYALHRYFDASRARAMKSFAEGAGYTYEATRSTLNASGLLRLPIFKIGKDRRFFNVMEARVGERDVLVFDYRHRVGGLLTSITDDSLIADFAIGIEKNREPTWYSMTVVALRAPRASAASRERVPGMPGGHTRVERDGEWLAFYRFDRRVPVDQLATFIAKAVSTAGAVADVRLAA